MADNETGLDIKITTTADLKGVQQTTAAVDDLSKTTKTYSKEEVEALTKSKDATEKATSSKKQMHEAVKGLSAAFPGLAAAARFALNPITLSIAAIGLSAQILRDKLSSVGEVLKT